MNGKICCSIFNLSKKDFLITQSVVLWINFVEKIDRLWKGGALATLCPLRGTIRSLYVSERLSFQATVKHRVKHVC